MNRRKLDRAWEALKTAQRAPQTATELETLARLCGREMKPGGNHPMWLSTQFPHHRPLPIGRHGGNRSLPKHATKVILNGLEADLGAWEEYLEFEENENE